MCICIPWSILHNGHTYLHVYVHMHMHVDIYMYVHIIMHVHVHVYALHVAVSQGVHGCSYKDNNVYLTRITHADISFQVKQLCTTTAYDNTSASTKGNRRG